MAPRWQVEAKRWHAEAEHLAGEVARLEAENVGLRSENAELRARVAELEAQVVALSEKVATLAKLVFGTSSEQKKSAQPVARLDADVGGAVGEQRRSRGQQPGSVGHGRRDYSGLETREEIHDVPEGERVCPQCGAPYDAFNEETSQQIDWQVRLTRILQRRPTYRRTCRCPGRAILAAPVPAKPIPKGLFTSQFLARLVVEKYVLGRPLERVVTALRSDGLEVAKGTLVGSLEATSALLAPLDAGIRARNAEAGHLHVDETSWNVYELMADKVNHRWWLWTFVGPDTSVFLIDPHRSTQVVTRHLGIDLEAGSLGEGRHLLLSSDFFTVYQSLAGVDGLDPLWCWAHIRRYFIRAGDAHQELKGWTEAWLERIRVLYVAHRALQASPGSPEHIRAEVGFADALGAMDTARKTEAADPGLHPAATKVLATLGREWEGLARHQSFPELPLDNNSAERTLRNPVVVRKNCYGSGAAWAATLAARVWTITATAARAQCNPLAYLGSYLDACAEAGGRPPSGPALARFFPWAASEADLSAWQLVSPGPAP